MNTRLLLALAAILITNSHLEKFYPWPLLAGDGLLGNSIFFMVAGLGITLSTRNKLRTFPDYYWRRIIRIYPTVLLVVTAFMLIPQRGWSSWDWPTFVTNYVWPTPWAFIEYVMVLYAFFYLLLKLNSARVFLWTLLGAFMPFGICWYLHPQADARLSLGTLHSSIWWVFWFQIMLLGGYLALRERAPPHVGRLFILFGISSAIYLGLKIAFVTGRIAHCHFLLFPVVLLIVYSVAEMAGAESIDHAWKRIPAADSVVRWIGSRTLEIYVIQGFVAYRDDLAKGIPFPANIVVFWLVLLLIAALVHAVVSLIQRFSRL